MHAVHAIVEVLDALGRFRGEEFKGEGGLLRLLGLFEAAGDEHCGGVGVVGSGLSVEV